MICHFYCIILMLMYLIWSWSNCKEVNDYLFTLFAHCRCRTDTIGSESAAWREAYLTLSSLPTSFQTLFLQPHVQHKIQRRFRRQILAASFAKQVKMLDYFGWSMIRNVWAILVVAMATPQERVSCFGNSDLQNKLVVFCTKITPK